MSAPAPRPPLEPAPDRAGFAVGFGTYQAVFGFVYLGLAVNLALAVAAAPLLVFADAAAEGVVEHPLRAWPLLPPLTLGIGPVVVAAFAAFRQHRSAGSTTPVLDLLAGLRRTGRRATTCWAATVALVTMLLVDLTWAWHSPLGALLVPVFAVLTALTLAVAMQLLVMLEQLPTTGLAALARAAVYLAVRRWYLSLGNLVVLVVVGLGIGVRPVPALAIGPACALYLVWSNNTNATAAAIEQAG